MNKIISLIIVSIIAFSAYSQDTTEILNKATLLSTTDAEMQDAIGKTELLIKDINQVVTLFERYTLVGARLWDKIKNDPNFNKIENGNITYKIPKFDETGKWVSKQDVQGKALQEIVHYLKLWTYIKTNYDLDKAQIVDENNRDKFIMWSYFAKIEEPIVTIQTDKARLILKYVKGKLFFIDLTSE